MRRRSLAKVTLTKARYYFDQTELSVADRAAFEREIETAIVTARSVTQHIQSEFMYQPGFGHWWSPYQQMMDQDPLFKLFRNTRNFILKEGPVDVHKVITASPRVIAVVSVVVEARVIRGKPWYRRSPTILWQDFHAAMMRPIRKWLRHREIARQRPQDQEQPSRQATESFYFDDPQWRHRPAPEWRNRPALELLREYLDRLEEIVNAAEAKFAPPGDDEKGDSDE